MKTLVIALAILSATYAAAQKPEEFGNQLPTQTSSPPIITEDCDIPVWPEGGLGQFPSYPTRINASVSSSGKRPGNDTKPQPDNLEEATYKRGFKDGHAEGLKKGEANSQQPVDDRYSEGYSQGRAQGITEGSPVYHNGISAGWFWFWMILSILVSIILTTRIVKRAGRKKKKPSTGSTPTGPTV
ncbi:MAG: hypothetical protein WD544_00550 [Patescibacteria group bacterium]